MLEILGLNNEYILERKIKLLEDNNKYLLKQLILLKKELKELKLAKEQEKRIINSYVIL